MTRAATREDVPALVEMWSEVRGMAGLAARAIDPASSTSAQERFARVVDDPAYRVLVAFVDGEPGGMAVLSTVSVGPLPDLTVVQVSSFAVRMSSRRRGVGRALIAAATAYAEETGVGHVVVNLFPGMREVNRFLARLGFVPFAVRRIAPVPALRVRLAGPARRRVAEDVMRRRSRFSRRSLPPQRVAHVEDMVEPDGHDAV